MTIDHAYAELGLPVGAGEAEVKAAWRRLVSRWHPDRNPSDEAHRRMQRINTAYERIRTTGFGDGTLDPAGGRADAPEAPEPTDPARTIRRKVRLTLEEAALGCTRAMRGRLTHACVVCSGEGLLKLRERCGGCQGTGRVRTGAWFGWMATPARCPECEGSGTVPRPCAACDGEGRHTHSYRRTVRFPAGVREGDVLGVVAHGEAPEAGSARLEIHVALAPHPFLRMDDDGTLHCEMPVDAFAWIAEAWVDVPTLTGLHHMRLRRGKHTYRLRGQGGPRERGGTARADYLVTIAPTFPDRPSPAQQALLEQLAAIGGEAPAGEPVRAWRETLSAWEKGRAARRA